MPISKISDESRIKEASDRLFKAAVAFRTELTAEARQITGPEAKEMYEASTSLLSEILDFFPRKTTVAVATQPKETVMTNAPETTAVAAETPAEKPAEKKAAPAKKTAVKKVATKKAPAKTVAKKAPAKKPVAKKAPAKAAAKKEPAKKDAAKKAPAKKASTKKKAASPKRS